MLTARRGGPAVLIGALGLVLAPVFSHLAASQPANQPTSTGCGRTPVRSDRRLPMWTQTAHPPSGVPYALSQHGDVAAILFGDPLRSGRPTGHSNKVLWIVRKPRNDRPLRLSAHPVRAASPEVREKDPADASPGEIYPSVLDVPSPGCWRVLLEWNGNRDTVDLRYR